MASSFVSRVRRISWISFKIAAYGALLGIVALGVAVAVAVSQLPSYEELVRRDDLGKMIRVRAADGTVIHTMGPSFGEWLPYRRIPEVMVESMVAVEDRRYHYHLGVDPVGMARSFWVRISSGVWSQGGSTITQQLARNIFLNNTRTFGRKIREAILAIALEWRFSKEQILELYLNRVYFGGGAYGVDAASRRFYGTSATELNLAQAAIIAGLVKAPSNYSPTADAEAARGRAGVVLGLMEEQELITPAERAAADPAGVEMVRPIERAHSTRYFTDWVLPQLDILVDQEVSEPIEVWTTIDVAMQQQADAAVRANVPQGAQGALVTLDRDGAVRAMVGGLDYVSSIYNRATQATRQPGSAFKLFVYLTALQSGYTPDSMVSGGPITVNGWSPRNDSGGFPGQISVRQAFAYSVNTAAVRLSQDVGTRSVASTARQFGITTPVTTQPSMALGASEVRLIDMVRAYASVSRNGTAVTPYGVRRVTTAGGTVLYEHREDDSRALVTPWVAAQMTDLLKAVVDGGTGRAAALGRPTAGKTGTTSSNKDGWFVGFSSGLTTGVWIGRDDNRRLPGLSGGRAPAQTFHDFMIRAVANRPAEDLITDVPGPAIEADVNSLGNELDPGLIDPYAVPQEEPLPMPMPGEEEDIDGATVPRAPEERRETLDQEWLDRAINRPPPRPQPRPPVQRPPAQQPQPTPEPVNKPN
jgi:penicillin-binding protein 1A